jgi:predicted  nucleic acid-binding Zn-ribbon protein
MSKEDFDYVKSYEILSKRYDSLAGNVGKLHAQIDVGYKAQVRLAAQIESAERDVQQNKAIVRTTILQAAEERQALEAEIIMLKAVIKNLEGVNNGDHNRVGN